MPELNPTLTVKTKVVRGHPGAVVVEEAKNQALVVVGNGRGGGVASLLVGSVGHHVVHLATCPMIVARVAAD